MGTLSFYHFDAERYLPAERVTRPGSRAILNLRFNMDGG